MAGAALGAYLEMDVCNDAADECLTCEGLGEIFVGCQSDGMCPDCPTWADHVIFVSDAPSVTPVRIQPPEDCIRNPESATRNHQISTIMVTEWFSTR